MLLLLLLFFLLLLLLVLPLLLVLFVVNVNVVIVSNWGNCKGSSAWQGAGVFSSAAAVVSWKMFTQGIVKRIMELC